MPPLARARERMAPPRNEKTSQCRKQRKQRVQITHESQPQSNRDCWCETDDVFEKKREWENLFVWPTRCIAVLGGWFFKLKTKEKQNSNNNKGRWPLCIKIIKIPTHTHHTQTKKSSTAPSTSNENNQQTHTGQLTWKKNNRICAVFVTLRPRGNKHVANETPQSP